MDNTQNVQRNFFSFFLEFELYFGSFYLIGKETINSLTLLNTSDMMI
jgi:hypothetical protein